MGHRMILQRGAASAGSVGAIIGRLTAAGVAIIDASDPIMLINGDGETVRSILQDFPGWTLLPFQYHDAPKTRGSF